jgi:hypothetical protein
MKDCVLNHPPLEEMRYPLDYGLIRQNQFNDAQLQLLHQQKPFEYLVMDMGDDVQLICQVRHNKPWCIAIPTVMADDIIQWYHLVLGHCGIVHLDQTISTHFVHPF